MTEPLVVTTRSQLRAAVAALPRPVGLVPTMGALHAGHAALLDAARQASASVVVSIFVNPLQFGPTEDLDRYPRPLAADLALAGGHGAALAWTPGVADMYPSGDPQVRVDPGPLGAELDGRSRPGHFAGVLTVVAKLLNSVRPDLAFFGEKDYQQLVLITRMVDDLDLDVRVCGVPIVRDGDGLALSSRNAYLSADERDTALAIPRALGAARRAAGQGPAAAERAADAVLARVEGVEVDYVAVRDPQLGPAPDHGPARMLVAARVGSTRLIDNTELRL